MLPAHLRILYLHGFASSPASAKAKFFAQNLAKLGVTLEVLDLCAGNFEQLTISGQMQVVEQAARQEPVQLIGSSLGGYLAALYASRHPEVDRLVLLAPAFQFHNLWVNQLGPERLRMWRENGILPIFHYGEGRQMPISYKLMEDSSRYEPFPAFCQPALIFHGNHDPVVPVQYSAVYAEAHPNVQLVRLESGHELTDVLDEIWRETKVFLLHRTVN